MAQSTGIVKQPVKLPGMESNCEFGVISSVIVVKQLVKTTYTCRERYDRDMYSRPKCKLFASVMG